MKYILPLIFLGALAFLGYTIMSGGFKTSDSSPAESSVDGDSQGSGIVAMPDLSDIDFGDLDVNGLQEKFSGITDELKDVSSDSIEGLVEKIKELTGSIDSMNFDQLTGVAKSTATSLIEEFIKTIENSLSGIKNDGLMATIQPVVDTLLEKLNSLK